MKYFVLFISILTLFSVNSQVNHSKWDALLTAHVSKSGIVDYNGFKADQSKLTAYLNELAANTPSSSWSSGTNSIKILPLIRDRIPAETA